MPLVISFELNIPNLMSKQKGLVLPFSSIPGTPSQHLDFAVSGEKREGLRAIKFFLSWGESE